MNCLILIICFISCTMNNLPEGKLLRTVDSPNGTYTVNAYLCSGNATTDFSIRGEVVINTTGEMRNIYWQYRCNDVEISWIDDSTVEINSVKLNVLTDSYDWRN